MEKEQKAIEFLRAAKNQLESKHFNTVCCLLRSLKNKDADKQRILQRIQSIIEPFGNLFDEFLYFIPQPIMNQEPSKRRSIRNVRKLLTQSDRNSFEQQKNENGYGPSYNKDDTAVMEMNNDVINTTLKCKPCQKTYSNKVTPKSTGEKAMFQADDDQHLADLKVEYIKWIIGNISMHLDTGESIEDDYNLMVARMATVHGCRKENVEMEISREGCINLAHLLKDLVKERDKVSHRCKIVHTAQHELQLPSVNPVYLRRNLCCRKPAGWRVQQLERRSIAGKYRAVKDTEDVFLRPDFKFKRSLA